MTPEGQKPSELNILTVTAIIGGIYLLSNCAFSSGIRKQIFNRDMGRDAWDGSTENLEAAHIAHDRSDPRYNHPSNGRLLCRRNHYIDHWNTAGTNGLSIAGNNAALRLIWARLSEQEREGLTPPPEEQGW